MIYRFSDFLGFLRTQPDVELVDPVPACPKHASPVCAQQTGSCPDGNERRCPQKCCFYCGTSLNVVSVTFLLTRGGQEGYVLSTDMAVSKLERKGVLDLSGLTPVSA